MNDYSTARPDCTCRVVIAGLWLGSTAAALGCAGAAATGPAEAVASGEAARPGLDQSAPGARPAGQPLALRSAPHGSAVAAPRPKMNAAAAQAHSAGLQAFLLGDLEAARNWFQQAVQADDKAYEAHHSLGTVRERLGDSAGAQTAYRRAFSIVPDYEPAIVAYALLLARGGHAADAEAFLVQKQARMPASAAVVAALAELRSLRGDSGQAQRLAQEALKRDPDYRPAMVTLARDHYRSRRLDLALYALRGILDGYGEENPPRDRNNAEARLLRALIYGEQDNRQGAIDELRRALKLRPDLVEACIHLATYVLEAGNAAEAAQLLEAAIRYDRGNVLARLNLGDAYRLLGRSAEALQQLQWVLQRDPSLAQAHYNLGLLYLFSESIPGVTPRDAARLAIREFELYKRKKPRSAGEARDDTDELIMRAKTKQAVIEARQSEAGTAASAAPGPRAPAAQGGGGAQHGGRR
jgi:Tfp pilus assembly protein PilF